MLPYTVGLQRKPRPCRAPPCSARSEPTPPRPPAVELGERPADPALVARTRRHRGRPHHGRRAGAGQPVRQPAPAHRGRASPPCCRPRSPVPLRPNHRSTPDHSLQGGGEGGFERRGSGGGERGGGGGGWSGGGWGERREGRAHRRGVVAPQFLPQARNSALRRQIVVSQFRRPARVVASPHAQEPQHHRAQRHHDPPARRHAEPFGDEPETQRARQEHQRGQPCRRPTPRRRAPTRASRRAAPCSGGSRSRRTPSPAPPARR